MELLCRESYLDMKGMRVRLCPPGSPIGRRPLWGCRGCLTTCIPKYHVKMNCGINAEWGIYILFSLLIPYFSSHKIQIYTSKCHTLNMIINRNLHHLFSLWTIFEAEATQNHKDTLTHYADHRCLHYIPRSSVMSDPTPKLPPIAWRTKSAQNSDFLCAFLLDALKFTCLSGRDMI